MQLNVIKNSLSVSLHDGILESLTSDQLARSVTLVVDVPFIWTFHDLSENTRFHIELKGVRRIEALQFAPWPGDFTMPAGLSWEEQEKLRRGIYDQGRMQSTDWESFTASFEHVDYYYVMSASIRPTGDASVLFTLNLISESSHEYPQIEVTADDVHFWLHPSQRELSLEEFRAMGGSYWDDFGKRTASPQSSD